MTKAPSSIPLLLNTVLAGLNGLSARELGQLGLTTQSARALLVLLHYPLLRCSAFARLLGLEATALSHLLRALARKHLIVRNRVENDNRAVEVQLSDRGRQVAKACQAATRTYERKLLTGLAADELSTLKRILGKMHDNIMPLRQRAAGGARGTARTALKRGSRRTSKAMRRTISP